MDEKFQKNHFWKLLASVILVLPRNLANLWSDPMTLESINEKVSSKEVLKYYQSKKVLEHYDEATRRIGLWKSEKLVFRQAFPSEQGSLLELGCGTGRIAFSLWSLGYEKIWATDFSSKMIRRSLVINSVRRTGIHFEKQDARNMSFEDQSFHGIIFGFNGLMQTTLLLNW